LSYFSLKSLNINSVKNAGGWKVTIDIIPTAAVIYPSRKDILVRMLL
jgi:hypothetical protein